MLRSLTLTLLLASPAFAQSGYLPTPGSPLPNAGSPTLSPYALPHTIPDQTDPARILPNTVPRYDPSTGYLPTPGAGHSGLDMTDHGIARQTTGAPLGQALQDSYTQGNQVKIPGDPLPLQNGYIITPGGATQNIAVPQNTSATPIPNPRTPDTQSPISISDDRHTPTSAMGNNGDTGITLPNQPTPLTQTRSYQGRVSDNQVETAPTGTRHANPTLVGETGEIIQGEAPGWNANIGPYSLPRWEHNHPQALWSDTRPRDANGNPVPVDTYSNSLRESDLPSPYTAPAQAYQPRHLYDRTVLGATRPGGNVEYTPFQRGYGGVANVQGHYIDKTQDSRFDPTQPHAPAWVSAKAEAMGDLGAFIWGQPVVFDGDTLLMNGEQIRLAGIDAPELNQICKQGSLLQACGKNARTFLAHHVEHQIIACYVHYRDVAQRLVSTCYGEDFEVNGTMILRGHALVWKEAPSPYGGMEADARDGQAGMWAYSFEHPYDWRLNNKAIMDGEANKQAFDKPQTAPFPFIPFGMNPEGRQAPVYDNPVTPRYYTRSRPGQN